MPNPGSVTRLLDQLRSSDREVRDEAARQIWGRYFPQLLDLARRNLHPRIRAREDEEDVLQNMYRSFCTRQRRGQFELGDRNDLWRLLVTMTLRKAKKVAAKHRRGGRNVFRDQSPRAGTGDDASAGGDWALEAMEAAEPTPAEAAVLNEELHRRLSALPEPLRQVALWKLEGYTNDEIAAPERLNCTERTVERKLQLIRKAWADA